MKRLKDDSQSGKTPFAGKYSDRSFSLNTLLEIHEGVHFGEKTLTCEYCDKKFNQSGSLKFMKDLMQARNLFTKE